MQTNRIDEYRLSGTWFEMGKELGTVQGLEIKEFNDRFFSTPSNVMRFGSTDNVWQYAASLCESIRIYSPDTYEFIRGIADGASLPIEQVTAQSSLPELTHISKAGGFPSPGACTAAFISSSRTATSGVLFGQNWDFNFDLPPWYVLKLIPPLDQPARIVVGAGSMFACCGVNGLGVTVSFTSSGHLPAVKPGYGLPVMVMVNEVLSTDGFESALELAVAPPRAGAYNMMVTEQYVNGAVVEAVPDRIEIVDESDILVMANHYSHEGLAGWTGQDLTGGEAPKQEFASSTTFRAKRLRELLDACDDEISPATLTEMLRDHENKPLSICAHKEGTYLNFETKASAIIEPGQRKISVCPQNPCTGDFQIFTL